jgi:hypothetical protein
MSKKESRLADLYSGRNYDSKFAIRQKPRHLWKNRGRNLLKREKEEVRSCQSFGTFILKELYMSEFPTELRFYDKTLNP